MIVYALEVFDFTVRAEGVATLHGINILEFIFIPVLIALNAFFVAAEMALARIRRTRIDQLVEEGHRSAVIVQTALNDPDRFIAACQLGITLCTLSLGAVGEHTFAQDMASAVMTVGIVQQWTDAVTSFARIGCYVLAFSLTAFFQTVFGELIPKTWTFERAEEVMMLVIWPMEFWLWLTTPFIAILNGFTEFVLSLLQVKEPPRRHFVHSEEELKMLVSASHEEGVLEEEQEEMLHSVFDFSNTTASEVMTPRTDMVCASAETSVKDFVNSALKHGLSRLPVYEEDIDSIFGLVHIRDGLKAIVEHKEYAPIRELARKILIVPENKDAGDLLTEFKKTKTHMAIVVDEYGTTRGLVTIEDLLEELVGDIADEYDVVAESISLQEDGTVIMDARISLDDANEKLGLNIEDEQFNTIGGHVFGLLGREPKVGDEVGNEHHTLHVEEADRHRIIRLRLIRRPFNPTGVVDNDGGNKQSADTASADSPSNKSLESKK